MVQTFSGFSGHLQFIVDMSLIGGNFSPYRIPAGGVPFFCAEYAHASGPVNVTPYTFSTVVPNYNAATGGTIPPYERFVDTSSSGACDNNSNCPTATNGIPCVPWIGTLQSSTSPQYTLVESQPNTAPLAFTAGTTPENLAVCHKRGFKNVAAKRWWHGIFRWLTPDVTSTTCSISSGHCDATNPSDWDANSTRAYIPYAAKPDTTKYRTISSDVTYNSSQTDYDGNETAIHATTSGCSISVNQYSGEITCSGDITEVDTTTPSGGSPSTTKNISHGYDSVSNTYNQPTVVDGYVTDVHAGNNPGPYNNDTAEYTSLDGWVVDFNGSVCAALAGGIPVTSSSFLPDVTDSNNYGSISSPNTGGYVLTDSGYSPPLTLTVSIAIAWTRTDTVYAFTFSLSSTYNYLPGSDHFNTSLAVSGTLSLSDTNTSDDVYADLASLLNEWPLNDDSLYPWRGDGYTNMAPKMSRLEVNGNRGPLQYGMNCVWLVPDYTNPAGSMPYSAWGTRAWFDGSIYEWRYPAGDDNTNSAATGLVKVLDGTMQGAPNPAGYQGYFRFDAEDMQCCSEIVDDTCEGVIWYAYGYGQIIPAYLPQNCTQWTNWFEVMNKPSYGALVAYYDVNTVSSPSGDGVCDFDGKSDGAFWAVKWAEIGETYQSINFARPAGYDKFLLDETEVFCYSTQSGSVVTLTNLDGTSPASLPFTTSDIVGGSCVGGFFSVDSVSGATVTLGAQKFNVPSDWSTPSGDQASAFGKLRFSTYPSLLGRIYVIAVADASAHAPYSSGWTPTYQFPGPETNFGMAWSGGSYTAHESIDIYDSAMTVLASAVTAHRTADNKFTLAAGYSTAYYVMIHGASCSPNYQYCDDYPKGDYVYLEWLYDNRTNAEITRLSGVTDCAGHTPPLSDGTVNNGFASFTELPDSLEITKCAPRVVCFSPNGEHWPNGNTYGFPSSFAADETYGSKWQAQVIWSITDPLWQSPHTPCNLTEGAVWTEDSAGNCPPDGTGIQYYGLPPMVEARSTVPIGFPALPTGITIGFNAPGSAIDPTNPPGLCGYDDTGMPSAVQTPWSLAVNICASESGCRFGYSNWAIGCPGGT